MALDEFAAVDGNRLNFPVRIVGHHLESELAGDCYKITLGGIGTNDHRRQVARGQRDFHRLRDALGQTIVGHRGANLIDALSGVFPREHSVSVVRLAKRDPLVRAFRFALIKNVFDGAIRIGSIQLDLHISRRTEKLAGTRRHDGDGGRLVVAKVADGHRLVTVHHNRDRFIRAGGVALPVVKAKAFSRLGCQRHLRARRVGRQAWLDADRALSRSDHGGQLIVNVDLDRVAVLNAKRIAQRDSVPTGLTGYEIGQLQPTLRGTGNRLVVFRPLNVHRRADGIQLK